MAIQARGKNTWRISIVLGKIDGKYKKITETFKGTKSDAKLREYELKVQLKSKPIIFDRTITFKQFSEKWLREYAQNLSPRTCNEYKKLLSKVNTYIGRIPLADLKPLQLIEYYNKIRSIGKEPPKNKKDIKSNEFYGEISENTILHHYTLISNILNKAVEWEFLERNPNSKVKRPKIEKHQAKFYDIEDVKKLLICIEKEPLKSKTLILLALDSGARRGELTGLDWEDINFEKSYIKINKTTQILNGKIIQKTPKTNSSIRIVPITFKTVEILKQYRREQLQKELKLGFEWEKTTKVFTTEKGGLMYPGTPSRILEGIIKKYNLPKITFHELRHTSVSLLINAGIQTQIVSKRVGHSSINTTSQIYAHIFESTEKEVSKKMNDILSAQ